jgi:hypothetical protein
LSAQAMAWAIGQRAGGPSGKVVLWSIANYANQHWCAWPSQKLIVDESEQSADSVQRRIPELEALGLVRRVPLRFAGRKTVDFYILPPSPWFGASLVEIEPLLPRGCTVDPKFAELHAAANRGSDKIGTLSDPVSDHSDHSAAALPQALPQPAENAAAMVRQHEPFMEPGNRERDARAHGEGKALNLRPVDDEVERESAFQRLLQPGGYPPAAIDNVDRARAAWADVEASAWDAALEAIPRFTRDRQRIKRTTLVSLERYIRDRVWERYPKPTDAEGRPVDEKVTIPRYSRAAWALFKRQYVAGKSVANAISWIRNGAEIQASAAVTEAEQADLVTVGVGSTEHVAWREHCKRLGFDLPMPDRTDWIFLPSKYPRSLSPEWKGYHLIEPVRIEIRGPAWWWRLYQPKAPIAELFEVRAVGAVQVEMGPIPLPTEVDGMVKIEIGTQEFEDWDIWFRRKGVKTIFSLSGPIWAPTKKPPSLHEPIEPVPDYEAIDMAIAGGER